MIIIGKFSFFFFFFFFFFFVLFFFGVVGLLDLLFLSVLSVSWLGHQFGWWAPDPVFGTVVNIDQPEVRHALAGPSQAGEFSWLLFL